MYIDYSKSFRRRGRRKYRKFFRILLVILIAGGLGLGTYFAIKLQMNTQESGGSDQGGKEQGLQNGTELAEGTEEGASTDINPEGTASSGADSAGSVGNTSEGTPSGGGAVPTIQVEPTKTPEASDTRIPAKVKGLYVTSRAAGTESIRDYLIEIADTTEINALVIDVKDDNGKITYSMDSPIVKNIKAATNAVPDMEGLVKELQSKGIYVIARIVAFKDPYLAEQRHELAIKKTDGSLYRDNNGECWVNPYNEEVWEYLVEVASKAAATGFNEIQFDYIRFSTGKGMDKVDFGEEAQTRTKEEVILEFTKYAYDKLKPLGVFVSADVYGTIISSKTDAGLVGQNYVEMSKYLDYICPMIYPSHFGEGNYGLEYPDLEPYHIIRKVMTASKEKLDQIPEGEHRAIVRPWLQDFTATWLKNHMTYGGDELRLQIEGLYAAGYEEWLLWNAGCDYSVEGLLEESAND